MNNFMGFEGAAFDIENALNLYADGFVTFSANQLYEEDLVEYYGSQLEKCHIYIIGVAPKINFCRYEGLDKSVDFVYELDGVECSVRYEIPEGYVFEENDGIGYLINKGGRRIYPDQSQLFIDLGRSVGGINFEVKYIGQSYGKEGSRNAVDRLLKHETLQKMAVQGVPEGKQIVLLLLSIHEDNRVVTIMNPRAKNSSKGSARIDAGLRKMFDTSESEKVSLYEASLIRYFYPEFNNKLKDNFPSTRMKMLQDCYDKDFCSIIAEICLDEIPYLMWSKSVKPKSKHIAVHYLSEEKDRRVFFALE